MIDNQSRQHRLTPAMGRLVLLLASLIWGTSFFVMKSAVSQVPVQLLLAFRFTVGFAILGCVFFRRWKGVQLRTVLRGAVCGVLYSLAYMAQTYGLQGTTPGKNAFLTAVYCVLSPFFAWLIFRKRPALRNWIAAVLCIVGIGLLSLDAQLTMSRGDALTLLGGVLFAVHLVYVSGWGEEDDPIIMVVTQMGVCAAMCWLGALLTGTASMPPLPAGAWTELIYLAVFATALAGLMQNVGQSVTPAAQSAILLSLESVFGAMFSCMVGADTLTLRLAAGFIVIFAAVLLGETSLHLPRRKERLR